MGLGAAPPIGVGALPPIGLGAPPPTGTGTGCGTASIIASLIILTRSERFIFILIIYAFYLQ
jgi:hypothetical protein